jgi:superfamily I DNA/RNA helicase
MLVGDGQQAIYPGGFSLRSAGLDVRGRSFLLRTNWRNTQRIAVAAEAAMGDLPFGDLEDGEETRRADEETPLPRRLGDAPELHILLPAQEADVLALLAEEALERFELADVAVLGRTNAVWQRLEGALKGAGVPTVRLKGYRGEKVDAVRVGTFAMSKGLEFKVVILVGASRLEWEGNPFWLSEESDRREWHATQRRTLFVAMTRARDRLVVVAGPQLPAALEGARANFDETSWA